MKVIQWDYWKLYLRGQLPALVLFALAVPPVPALTVIPENAFANLRELRRVVFLDGLTAIGENAFGCYIPDFGPLPALAELVGFDTLTTTLASSRWKDLDQVNRAGEAACAPYEDVEWWPRNWRKGGLQERRNEIIREQHFYNQRYCGCEFSEEISRLRSK